MLNNLNKNNFFTKVLKPNSNILFLDSKKIINFPKNHSFNLIYLDKFTSNNQKIDLVILDIKNIKLLITLQKKISIKFIYICITENLDINSKKYLKEEFNKDYKFFLLDEKKNYDYDYKTFIQKGFGVLLLERQKLKEIYLSNYRLINFVNENNIFPKGIIHVGAHYGEEISEYLNLNVENILLFEPNEFAFKRLSEKINKLNSNEIKAYKIAISDSKSEKYLNIANYNQSSSLLELKDHKEYFPNTKYIRKEKVKVNTLDQFFVDYEFLCSIYNILIIDVQGAELKVLKGAFNTLSNIDLIIVEINFMELYKNCPSPKEVNNFLKGCNFTFKKMEKSHDYWADFYFIKVN